jgi:hypothetical protein
MEVAMLIAQDEEGWRNTYVQSAQETKKGTVKGHPISVAVYYSVCSVNHSSPEL